MKPLRSLTEVLQRKDRPDLTPRAVGDYDRVRLRQSKSRVARLGTSPRTSFSLELSDPMIAHDHEPSGDAEPNLKGLPVPYQARSLRSKPGQPVRPVRGRLHGRPGSRKDKDTVTHATGSEAAEPGHDLCNALLGTN